MSWIADAMSSVSSGKLPLGDWSGGWTDFSSGQSKLKDAIRRYENSSKEMTTWEALNLPTLQKQGLMDAGFNPILALGNLGGGMASALSATHSGAGEGSVSFDKLVSKQMDVLDSELELNEANSARAASEASLNDAKSKEVDAQTAKVKQQTTITEPIEKGVKEFQGVRDSLPDMMWDAHQPVSSAKDYITTRDSQKKLVDAWHGYHSLGIKDALDRAEEDKGAPLSPREIMKIKSRYLREENGREMRRSHYKFTNSAKAIKDRSAPPPRVKSEKK